MTIASAPLPGACRGATHAALDAARQVVRHRRWYLGLTDDRPMPDDITAVLERALASLDAEEADRGRY